MKTPGEISFEMISEASVPEPAARPWKPSPVAASNLGPRSVAAHNSREPAEATLAVPCVVDLAVVDAAEVPPAETANPRTATKATATTRRRGAAEMFMCASITDF